MFSCVLKIAIGVCIMYTEWYIKVSQYTLLNNDVKNFNHKFEDYVSHSYCNIYGIFSMFFIVNYFVCSCNHKITE